MSIIICYARDRKFHQIFTNYERNTKVFYLIKYFLITKALQCLSSSNIPRNCRVFFNSFSQIEYRVRLYGGFHIHVLAYVIFSHLGISVFRYFLVQSNNVSKSVHFVRYKIRLCIFSKTVNHR